MPRNILFSILDSYKKRNSSSSSSSSTTTSSAVTSTLPQPESGFSIKYSKNYFVISLPTPLEDDLDYLIKETHITFFDSIDDDSEDLYHYTATLIKGGQEFKVRVFFNKEGQARVDCEESLSKEEEGVFLKLANAHCPAILNQIQEYQNKRILALKTAIKGLLEESADLSLGYAAAVAMLQELKSIGGGSMRIGKTVLSRLYALELEKDAALKPKSSQSPPTVIDSSKENLEEHKAKKELKEGKGSEASKIKRKKQNKKNHGFFDKQSSSSSSSQIPVDLVKKEEAEKAEALEDLQKILKKIASLKDRIGGYFRRISALDFPLSELLLEKNMAKEGLAALMAYSVYDDEIQSVDYLIIESALRMSHYLCLNCLEILIENFEVPESRQKCELLRSFVKYLSPGFVSYAIFHKKYDLLRWLLEEGDFQVDTIMVNLNRKKTKAIEYAYQTKDINAFKILMEYKPFIFLYFPTRRDTLVDEIEREPTSPFKAELNTLQGQTLRVRQQMELLQFCIDDPQLLPSKKEVVQKAYNKGEEFIESTKTTSKGIIKSRAARYENFLNMLSSVTSNGIFKDADILNSYKNAHLQHHQSIDTSHDTRERIYEAAEMMDIAINLGEGSYSQTAQAKNVFKHVESIKSSLL